MSLTACDLDQIRNIIDLALVKQTGISLPH